MDKKLLQKYVDGTISSDDVETVVDWLDADENHVKEFMALHKLYDISILNQSIQEQKKKKGYRVVFRSIVKELLKVAAIALILLGVNSLLQKEIAEEMNISINTVETQMGIAYKKLRNELKDYFPLFIFLYYL